MTKKLYKFSEIINLQVKKIMKKNNKVICYGLGINDPKSIFGTTKDLQKQFGNKRVFDAYFRKFFNWNWTWYLFEDLYQL